MIKNIFFLLLSSLFLQQCHSIEQIHMSLTGNDHQTLITWETKQNTYDNIIRYGLYNNHNKDELYNNRKNKCVLNMVSTNVEDVRFNNTCENYCRITYLHYGILDYLQPNSIYCYQLVNNMNVSNIYSFRMFDYNKRDTSILIYGDYDNTNNNNITAKSIYSNIDNIDFIIHNGDIAYDMFENNGTVGDKFLNKMEFITSRMYYMTTPGNHERYSNFSHYKNRFKNDNLVNYRDNNYYWSIELSNAKIITINTDLYYDDMGHSVKHFSDNDNTVGSLRIQYRWLENEIISYRQNKNTKNNYIIVLGHHPLYCSNIDYPTLSSTCQGINNQTNILQNGWYSNHLYSLENLFYKHNVTIYISSHVHAYERLYPSYHNNIFQYNYYKPQSYIHIMTGNAGVTNDMDVFTNKIPISAFQLNGTESYGYGILHINDNVIIWQQFDSLTNYLIDEISIVI